MTATRCWIAWCRATAFASLLVLQVAVAAMPPTTSEMQVREAEQSLSTARGRGESALVADFLANDYTLVDVFGHLHDRDISAASVVTTSVCESVHVHNSVAVVIAHEGETRVMRVWMARNRRWSVAAEQRVVIQPGRTDPAVSWTAGDVHESPGLETVSDVRDVLRAQDALDRANAMHDPDTFVRLTDPDFVVITNQGLVRSKADRVIQERIARLEQQPERPRPRRDDVRVRLFGPVAIITARNWPRTFEGAPRPPTRYTRVWLRSAAGWQQLANISTFVVPSTP